MFLLFISGTQIHISNEINLLPSIASVINLADCDEKKNFVIYTSMEEVSDNYDILDQDKEDVLDMDLSSVDSNSNNRRDEIDRQVPNRYELFICITLM